MGFPNVPVYAYFSSIGKFMNFKDIDRNMGAIFFFDSKSIIDSSFILRLF